MQELINRLTEKAGISSDQAHTAIHTIKEFIKEKFPMMAGAVDNFFPGSTSTETMNTANNSATTATTTTDSGSMMDKISDFIPGEMGQKVEDFAKGLFGDKK
ncbi:MAG: hypothetical protein ABI402_17085 [Ferruginibacter sp.]